MPTSSKDAVLRKYITTIPEWPKPGVTFLDISPLLSEPIIFQEAISELAQCVNPNVHYSHIIALESRGFLFGTPLAIKLDLPFHMARKQGKLPPPTRAAAYSLEYGKATLELNANVSFSGQNVLIVDDVIATGGSILAAQSLAKQAGAKNVHALALIALDFLPGMAALEANGLKPRAVLHY